MYKKFEELKYFFILHYAVNKKMRIAVSHDTTIPYMKELLKTLIFPLVPIIQNPIIVIIILL